MFLPYFSWLNNVLGPPIPDGLLLTQVQVDSDCDIQNLNGPRLSDRNFFSLSFGTSTTSFCFGIHAFIVYQKVSSTFAMGW